MNTCKTVNSRRVLIKCKSNAPIANLQTILASEGLDCVDVTYTSLAKQLDRRENLFALLDRNAVALFKCGSGPDVTPRCHASSSQYLRTSSCEYS